ncbi:MAG: beta-sandwich domain-containing protein [Pseudobdellovibrionaceae bacterium]
MKKKLVLGMVIAAGVLQAAMPAYADRSYRGSYDNYGHLHEDRGYIENSAYEGNMQISYVSRRAGGEWYRVTLAVPVALDHLEVQSLNSGVKIHEALVITENGNQIGVREFQETPVFYSGSRAVSENLNYGRVVEIDLRMESYGGGGDVLLKAVSLVDRPQLSYGSVQPAPSPVQPPPPPYSPRPYPPVPPPMPQPPSNYSSLQGYCPDMDHSQFTQAKQFAYAGNGLDYMDNQATNWALDYNQSHRCNSIQEYIERYNILYQVAYQGNGLNYTSAQARDFALSLVETTSVHEAHEISEKIVAAYQFAYAGNGLNKTSDQASQFGLQWALNHCEGPEQLNQIWERFKNEYQFAYSGNGLNMTSAQATQYAANKVASMSRCGNLLAN